MDVDNHEDQFRIYSEREIDAGVFQWNPHMDLLAVLSADPSNLSVSVHRLISDKQTGSSLLFTEKVPYSPSCVSWVPDKRSLAVGDSQGNVFVYDAERERTVELQKVHDCKISSISWVELALQDSFDVSYLSTFGKVPDIFATPSTFISDMSDTANIDDSERLWNDSLARSDRSAAFMSVMGDKGKVQVYYGGSIPVAEFSISTLFGSMTPPDTTQFRTVLMSEDVKCLAVLAESLHEITVFLVNTGLFFVRRSEITTLCRLQSDMHWLLKQLSVALSAITRATQSCLEEFDLQIMDPIGTLSGEKLENLKLGKLDNISLTGAKVSKIGKSTLSCLDFINNVLVTRVGVIIDHLTLAVCQLADMAEWKSKYSVLGLEESTVNNLLNQAKKIRFIFDSKWNTVKDASLAVRWLLFYLESALDVPAPAGQRFPPTEIICLEDFSGLKKISNFDEILIEFKFFESNYVQLLSNQRRMIASRISPLKVSVFDKKTEDNNASSIRWTDGENLDICWCEESAERGVSTLIVIKLHPRSGNVLKRTQFRAPSNSVWERPICYTDEKICVLLLHQDFTRSICLLKFSQFDSSQLDPSDYGYSSCFIAQKLPDPYSGESCSLEVSGSRGLASVLTGGRMITLDLENCDEDEDQEQNVREEEEEERESSAVPRRRKDLKRIDSILDTSENHNISNSSTPKEDGNEEATIRALKFSI